MPLYCAPPGKNAHDFEASEDDTVRSLPAMNWLYFQFYTNIYMINIILHFLLERDAVSGSQTDTAVEGSPGVRLAGRQSFVVEINDSVN